MIVFSHGFGVLKDSRGLFTDIASALGEESTLLDYNSYDKTANVITVTPIDRQVSQLQSTVEKIHEPVDLICHSQGCVIAALAMPHVRSAIFLAPATSTTSEKLQQAFADRPRTNIVPNGLSTLQRKDGTVTHVHPEYWDSVDAIGDSVERYREFGRTTKLSIITAEQDEKVRHKTGFRELSDVAHVETIADADHNFRNEHRGPMIDVVIARLETNRG